MPKRATRPTDPEAVKIGRVLRAIRTDQGLTQEEVAGKLPIGEGAYAAYESGRSRFTVPDLQSVARALGVPAPYLSRRLGLCGDDVTDDIAHVLVTRFGPRVGSALVRLDRVLAQMEHGDADALSVIVANTAGKYEHGPTA